MNLMQSEIESIDDIGEMDGSPVKLVRCVGGFFIAVGRHKGKSQDEALASGSHSAIVKFNLEKNFKNFRPVMEKSESFEISKVRSLGFQLNSDMLSKGYDFHSIEKNEEILYTLSKYGSELTSFKAFPTSEALVIMSPSNQIGQNEGYFASALVKAVAADAEKMNKTSIVYRDKSYQIADLKKK